MGVLREQMHRDLRLAGFSLRTIPAYLNHAHNFAAYFMRSPADLGDDQIREYLAHLLVERDLGQSSCEVARSALKFLYTVTLKRPFEVAAIPAPKRARRVAVVLSGSEVQALLEAVREPKYKLIFSLMYASGLRTSEACRLRVENIDSQRGLIHVIDGKGKVDRYTVLPNKLLERLRAFYRAERPSSLLFPGRVGSGHVKPKTAQNAFRAALRETNIRKCVTPYVLRHSFATHLLELGVDVTIIQSMLGHKNTSTTTRYAHVRADLLRRVENPFELMGSPAAQILG